MSTETETMTTDQLAELAAHPHTFDDLLADRYRAWEQASRRRDGAGDRIHSVAGDRREGRQHLWRRTMGEVMQTARIMAAAGESRLGIDPAQALDYYDTTTSEMAVAMLAVTEMEDIYNRPRNRWQRFFPCTNRDGHIHASYRDCPTVSWTTPMAWRPDLSGLTVEEAVQMPPAGLGPALCSVCFPEAPVEQRSMTTGQVADELTRAERDAARAARELARAAKQLTETETDEIGRTEYDRDQVTTVARCKEIIRKAIEEEVQQEYYDRPGAFEAWQADRESFDRIRANIAGNLAKLQRDAGRCAAVLQARETAHPGWGADQAAITKIQQAKYKSARREWGL